MIGLAINASLMILIAYLLSKNASQFGKQKVYMNLVIFAMLFSGGLIPVFMVVKELNLVNTIWALILLGAVPIGNVILLMNAILGELSDRDTAYHMGTAWGYISGGFISAYCKVHDHSEEAVKRHTICETI